MGCSFAKAKGSGNTLATEGKDVGDVVKQAGRKEILEILEEQQYCCALTGVELTPDSAQLDHVVPESKGGTHDKRNLQILHKTVNSMKAAMTQEDFVSWCMLVANHVGKKQGV